MGTQLNIKDERTAETLRAWARQEGRSVTSTLRDLVEREEERRRTERADRLRAMEDWARQVQAEMPAELRGMTSKEIMDSIYDDEPGSFAR